MMSTTEFVDLTWTQMYQDIIPNCILPLDDSSYKGSSGRIAVIGGSALYTGAPYYASTAALQTGADLVTVFTAQEAAIPLKCYSPELMVQPVYSAQAFDSIEVKDNVTVDEVEHVLKNLPRAQQTVEKMIDTVCKNIGTYHCLVVGPGLGRSPYVGYAVGKILQRVRNKHRSVPVILDADALWFLSRSPKIWKSFAHDNTQVILTPNRVEMDRLLSAYNGTEWANKATIIEKRARDTVAVGLKPGIKLVCMEEGGKKRSGGIGDVLAGTTATFAAWQHILQKRETNETAESWTSSAWTACHLVKRATYKAWQAKKRAMTAPDVLSYIGRSYEEMIGHAYKDY